MLFLKIFQISLESTSVGVFLNRVSGRQNWDFIKKRQQHRCFPVKFLRTNFSTEHLQWLLLAVSGFQLATLLKRRLWQRCFSVNFAQHLLKGYLPGTVSCVYLWILRNFSEQLFNRAPPGSFLFHVRVAEF